MIANLRALDLVMIFIHNQAMLFRVKTTRKKGLNLNKRESLSTNNYYLIGSHLLCIKPRNIYYQCYRKRYQNKQKTDSKHFC